uniref:GIY-YIG domain-containing protein n=1 Tax=Pundamilia nyererei TaxID=303518 RepID=A0A3B4FKP6_9CICH
MHRKEDQRPTREDKKDKRNNIVIPYVTVLSEKLRRVFSKHDITVYFRPSNTLRQKLVHPKHKTPKHNLNNVVYAVQCSEKCLDLYIGETKQPLHKRMSQHRRATSRLSCPSTSKGQRPLLRGHQCSHLGQRRKMDVQRMCGKNTKVLCFPKDMVNNLKERILQIADEYPTVTNIVLHTGSNDVSKQQTEVLKPDFTGLLNTRIGLSYKPIRPVPLVRGGDERFGRLFALNKWLISACTDHSVHFINNFNIFWECRHLFKANGFNFNKSGVKLFTSNLFYSILPQTP